ncbi:hypothetical protein TSUD_330810 [Trifolium subterraneum]|nr:hypothetical protein TSUD_330810 [Trifolium subterraneum]
MEASGSGGEDCYERRRSRRGELEMSPPCRRLKLRNENGENVAGKLGVVLVKAATTQQPIW